jgi:hypothetical protein
MKLRLKDNSIRIRLTRSEVKLLTESGSIEEHVDFGEQRFQYIVKKNEGINEMTAQLNPYSISINIPTVFLKDWNENEKVGFSSLMKLNNGSALKILVEKDFVCLDDTEEDQSDNYINPNSTCLT